MEETYGERAYFSMEGLYEETIKKTRVGNSYDRQQLPQEEPSFQSVIALLKRLEHHELDNNDRELKKKLKQFMSWGKRWIKVYNTISFDQTNEKIKEYDKLFLEILSLLKNKVSTATNSNKQIEIDDKNLEEDMEFFKINVEGYENTVPGFKEKKNSDFKIKKGRITKKGKGDTRVYVHNPLREKVIFVKKRFLRERFPSYLVPFMKEKGLTLYLCDVNTMLGDLAAKYGKDNKLDIIAVSCKKYLKEIDDRTLFIVLKDKIPVELCYGGLLTKVSLVQMQTFAFCAGVNPKEINTVEMDNSEKQFDEHYSREILDTNRIAMLGWWNGTIERVVELYMQ